MAKEWKMIQGGHPDAPFPMLQAPSGRVFALKELFGGKWEDIEEDMAKYCLRNMVLSDQRATALQELRQFIVDGLASGYIAFPPALDPPSLALRQIDALMNGQPEPQEEVPQQRERGVKHARELLQEFIDLNDEQSNITTTQLVLKYHKLIEKARTWMALFPKKDAKPKFPPNETFTEGRLKR